MRLLEKSPLWKWWDEAKEHYHPDMMIRFILSNRDRLEEYLSHLDGNKRIYRTSNRIFSLFSRLAGLADRISESIQDFLQRFIWLRGFIQKGRDWKNHLNFKETVEFARTKLYSLRHPPHNERAIRLLEEIMDFASRHGLDLNTHIPNARQKLHEKKHQMMQHKFFQEFSKSKLEQLLAIQFSFDRNIFPVLPDSAFWHKFFEYLERRKVTDIVLVNGNGEHFSLKKSDPAQIASTDVIRILKKLSEIKKRDHRIFFVGHHEGYLGPYFVRSVVRKLGFDNLTKNCNTVVGPRMFSNLVLRNGAANVGNLFITVPSQKTTSIKTQGLAEELRKTARRTQCLIKFPDAGLSLIEKLDYDDFMRVIVYNDADEIRQYLSSTDAGIIDELMSFLESENFAESMRDFNREDYDLFKKVMRECFLIFPEGSRSYIDPDGAVVMKYINPKYFQAYMRPGDYIAPINLVGGSDLTRGWRLRPARLGISMEEPYMVTAGMIENYEEEGLGVMRKIAALPNIKQVRFKEEIQFRKKTGDQE